MRTGCGYDDILDGNTDNYVIFSHFIKLIQPYWTHNSYLEEQRGETLWYNVENVENMRTPLFLINKSVQFHPKKKVFWKPCSVSIPLYCSVDSEIFHPWPFEVDTVNIAELRSSPPAGWKCPEKVIHQYSV